MQDLTIGDDLWEYMRRVTLREPALLLRLREETAPLPKFQLSRFRRSRASLWPC